MNRADVIAAISANADTLRKLGARSLALFGSFARDEATSASDVDFLVELTDPRSFDAYMDIKEFLESLLKRRIDLVTHSALRPLVKPYVERDLLRVA